MGMLGSIYCCARNHCLQALWNCGTVWHRMIEDLGEFLMLGNQQKWALGSLALHILLSPVFVQLPKTMTKKSHLDHIHLQHLQLLLLLLLRHLHQLNKQIPLPVKMLFKHYNLCNICHLSPGKGQGHHQDSYMCDQGSRPKPSLATVTVKEEHPN